MSVHLYLLIVLAVITAAMAVAAAVPRKPLNEHPVFDQDPHDWTEHVGRHRALDDEENTVHLGDSLIRPPR
jgi:hypothetical protein